MATIACIKDFTLEVTSVCGPATDWIAAPGTCRLRIRNYNPADFTFGALCVDCNLDGNPDFGGVFSTFAGAGHYDIPGGTSVLGFEPLGGFISYVEFVAGTWYLALICQGTPSRYVWLGARTDASPIGNYTLNAVSSCATGPLTLEIEGYSL